MGRYIAQAKEIQTEKQHALASSKPLKTTGTIQQHLLYTSVNNFIFFKTLILLSETTNKSSKSLHLRSCNEQLLDIFA